MAKANKAQAIKAGRYKIRPRAGEWGFLVKGEGKSQFQKPQDKKQGIGKQ